MFSEEKIKFKESLISMVRCARTNFKEISRETGINRTTLNYWSTGGLPQGVFNLLKLHKHLEEKLGKRVPLEDLFYGPSDDNSKNIGDGVSHPFSLNDTDLELLITIRKKA